MTVASALVVGIASALVAMELWGFAQIIARGIIVVSTFPLDPVWRPIRREELRALVRPCGGERRITALARLILIAVRLVTHDIVVGRVRRPPLHRPSPRRGHQSGAVADIAVAQTHLEDALLRNNVAFVTIGGVARGGFARDDTPLDITVATDGDNAVRLKRALQEVGLMKTDYGALGKCFRTRYGRLQNVRHADGVGTYDDWRRAAREINFGHGTIVVASAAHIKKYDLCLRCLRRERHPSCTAKGAARTVRRSTIH